MRLFVAIELPENLKNSLSEIISSLVKSQVNAKWVNAENLHMTLKFLGNTDEDKLPEIIATLNDISRNQTPFSINISKIQFFPPRGKPRILSVETDQHEHLKILAEGLQDRLEKCGFSKEGRFKPHITLARLQGTRNISQLIQLAKSAKLSASFPVESVALYKSTLTTTGPIYKVLHRASFLDKER